jgi:biopolymer transport protein ExbD
MAKRRKRGYRQLVEADLDILPLMNLFVVLIPMLLLSAVFVQLAVVDLNLPPADAQVQTPEAGLDLSVTIESSRYVIESRRQPRQVIERADPEAADLELASTLSGIVQSHPGTEDIVIVAQGDTRYQDVITLMDISREAGLPGVSLAGADR